MLSQEITIIIFSIFSSTIASYTQVYIHYTLLNTGVVEVMIVWQLYLQLTVESVSITTKPVSSNHVHSELYSVQHCLIKFGNDLRQVGCFLRFPSPINTGVVVVVIVLQLDLQLTVRPVPITTNVVIKHHVTTISLEMPVPSQDHCSFHSFPVVD